MAALLKLLAFSSEPTDGEPCSRVYFLTSLAVLVTALPAEETSLPTPAMVLQPEIQNAEAAAASTISLRMKAFPEIPGGDFTGRRDVVKLQGPPLPATDHRFVLRWTANNACHAGLSRRGCVGRALV
jgi:hypothetical protein